MTDDRRPLIVRTQVVLGIIDLVAVGLRFWSRRLSRAPLWWDDWFCLFLLVSIFSVLPPRGYLNIYVLQSIVFPYNVFNGLLVIAGQGRHAADLPDHGAKAFLWVFGDTLWYTFDLAMFKYGILLLYIRIFPQRWLRPFVITLSALIAVWLVIMELVFLFKCKPIYAAWDLNALATAKCLDFVHVFIGQSVPTIFFDLIILSLPPILVWRVRIPAIDKTSVVATFLLCGLVTGASVVRLVLIIEAKAVDTSCTSNFIRRYLHHVSDYCALQGPSPPLASGPQLSHLLVWCVAAFPHTASWSEQPRGKSLARARGNQPT